MEVRQHDRVDVSEVDEVRLQRAERAAAEVEEEPETRPS